MAKGDDALARKKNKLNRKKMSRKNDSATVSTRVASLIAAKKRRKSGKRSMCQGMCFSLPSPEDPFNERQGKPEIIIKKTKNNKNKSKVEKKSSAMSINGVKMDSPRKFLMECLGKIQTSLQSDNDITYSDEPDTSFFYSTWGIEFWKCFHYSGKNIMETSGKSATVEQIAWLFSTATDAMAIKEKADPDSEIKLPFLLYIVPSQSRASEVRSVCKALKSLGVHAVSLHQGASIDHQIDGLKSCEPEFVISTPERLLEIVALKGLNISGVSLLVIDELDSLCSNDYLDDVNSIKKAITSRHKTIIFNDKPSGASIVAVQSLLGRSVNRLSGNDSVASQGSCIIQTVNICSSEEKKLQKFAEILDSISSKTIYIVTLKENFGKLKALLKLKGYSVIAHTDSDSKEVKKSRKPVARLVDIEELDTTDMSDFETVLLPDFFPSFDKYVQILTSMARNSVRGVLQSFLTKKEAAAYQAGPLVNVLEECGQNVPELWKNMYGSSMSD